MGDVGPVYTGRSVEETSLTYRKKVVFLNLKKNLSLHNKKFVFNVLSFLYTPKIPRRCRLFGCDQDLL